MRLGFGFGVTMPASTAAVAIAAALSSINAEGWSGEWASGTPPTFTPDTAPQTIAVARQGFTAAGAATSYTESRTFTRRVRRPYPDQATDTPTSVALDDYVYSTDAIAGVTNNSTEASPKPVAAWAMPHRSVVADTIALEVVAFHRDARVGRMVAAVEFIATDGTTTVSQFVSATSLSARPGDAQPLPVFATSLNISTLSPGLITVNAKVYPWIGSAASILSSADQTALREFSPRYFLKNPALATSPRYAYVSASGSTSGVVSTTAATAKATPFDSVKNAADALQTAGGVDGLDGSIIRIGAGTFALASWTSARVQKVAAITIERDPDLPRASCIVSFGAAAWTPQLTSGLTVPSNTGCLRFRDVAVQRTGTGFINGGSAALEIQWENVSIDNGSFSGSWLGTAANYFYGATVTNAATSWLGAVTGKEHRIIRGMTADLGDAAWENWVTLACALTRPGNATLRDPTKGAITFQNKFLNPAPTAQWGGSTVNPGETIVGFWMMQNLIELTRTGSGPKLALSPDGIQNGNTYHCGMGYNTYTGQGSAGRHNYIYDNNTNGVRRIHRLNFHKGDIVGQLNNKGDIDIQDGTALGQFANHHGVGCQGNWAQFSTNVPFPTLTEAQAYPGRKSNIGTSTTARNDPGFTSYQGVTGAGAGAGGGDYRLTAGAPARGIVLVGALSHDLAGQIRPTTNDTPGAYA